MRRTILLLAAALSFSGTACDKVHVTFGDQAKSTPMTTTTPAPRAEVHATPMATPEAPVRPRKSYELVTMRGRAGQRLGEGQVIMPVESGALHLPMSRYQLPANASARDSQRIAQLAADEERKAFGPLLVMKNGQLVETDWKGANEIEEAVIVVLGGGRVLKEGALVNLLLGPLKMRAPYGGKSLQVYSANCSQTLGATGSWMWERKENPLQRAPYNRR